MRWSVEKKTDIWSVKLGSDSGLLSVVDLSIDGESVESGVIIELSKNNDALIVRDGQEAVEAIVTKIKDSWWITIQGQTFVVTEADGNSNSSGEERGGLTAPMPGIVTEILVKEGQRVRSGQPLMILEAMKMEHQVTAPKSGQIEKIYFSEGEKVDMGSDLLSISD